MRVIVFIGHHKVGSSALQRHLAETAPASVNAGLLFPLVTSEGQAQLARAIRKGHATQPIASRNVFEAHNALAFNMMHESLGAPIPAFHAALPAVAEMFASIRAQIATYRPRVLVLAAEAFANFGVSGQQLIRQLYAGLGLTDGDSVEIVAFLRRVDDYLASWHGQRVRLGEKVRPLPAATYHHYPNTIHLDYRKMLEPWALARPDSRLIIKSYDGQVRKRGSVAAFAQALDLELPERAAPVKKVNESIHRGLLDMARRANHALTDKEADRFFLSCLKIGPKLTIGPSSQVELFGHGARNWMNKTFAPIHDWTSGLIGAPLFEDYRLIRQCLPMDEVDASAAALAQIRADHLGAFSREGRAFLAAFDAKRHFPAAS